ncbi:hypothetical protein MOC47_05625 [Bacillus spizizenii]|uniref:Uncharacterized protein n=1 Tax=Bacillus spizizenii TaxID=96241 RepID=A0A9Q4HER8_BACSC|nr:MULTISPECIES: hypothetical protein [Bacillus subtilis group]MCY7827688.1 hypothetical protein [Bacillus spizizenii]MCY7841550.1 hypothetical protein [Bacillus spizizenii]MCY7853358.1 hypothetical protein [Bacillus spizizenii]MCY8065058.1 hypothetical protein [Bacillus spizizenii]MCY8121952.1 hypothetical protein [Bacillus spizizenii]
MSSKFIEVNSEGKLIIDIYALENMIQKSLKNDPGVERLLKKDSPFVVEDCNVYCPRPS